MLHALVYIFCLLLSLTSCAKKRQSVSCANPDPVTGACLRDATSIADPNELKAAYERALQSKVAAERELRYLREKRAEVGRQIDSGERPASDRSFVDAIGETIIKINDRKEQSNSSLPPKPEVNTSKAPVVTLNLKNKNNTGVRPTFTFAHTTGITEIKFNYGAQGKSQVFLSNDFVPTKMQLLEVKIPLELRFKFNDKQHCASIELSKDFDSGNRPMTVGECR